LAFDIAPRSAPLRSALIQLGCLAGVAVLLGALVNALRPHPLAWKYQSAAERFVAGAQAPVSTSGSTTAPVSTSERTAPPRLLSYEETKPLLGRKDVLLLDARPHVFYQAGHLPGAISLPRESFAADFPKVDAQLRQPGVTGIVIYCSGGECEDSAGVAEQLAARKIGPLAIYEGGWEDWINREPAAK
jgi:rhodanese-related sulfurtransferase